MTIYFQYFNIDIYNKHIYNIFSIFRYFQKNYNLSLFFDFLFRYSRVRKMFRKKEESFKIFFVKLAFFVKIFKILENCLKCFDPFSPQGIFLTTLFLTNLVFKLLKTSFLYIFVHSSKVVWFYEYIFRKRI